MTAILDRLDDNAMFYKDITQWLRNRTFTALFFGMLLVAEAFSMFAILNEDRFDSPGTFMYFALYYLLLFYGFVIGSNGKERTKQEYQSGTFDLFVLCGMRAEKMVRGKLMTLMYEFGFGFFCVAPFMFFAYFLGGLDFLVLVTGCVAICAQLLVWYSYQMVGALMIRKPGNSALGLVVKGVVWFFFFMWVLLPVLGYQYFMVKGLADIVKELFSARVGWGIAKLAGLGIVYWFVLWIGYALGVDRVQSIGRRTVEE